ncbi:MFS transporter [Micromonospora sp. NPDC000663]|uniref:MFS transporter n=1 Tax=Micromonospora sp. NPDC000663 TaxID=3364218 RepID=UPI0036AC78C4
MTNLAKKPGQRRLPTDFYLVLSSQGVSLIGSEMQQIALPLWVYQATGGSTLSAGVAFAFQFVPIVLLAPWAGYIADRFDRRKLMIVCELSATVMVAITLLGLHYGIVPLVILTASVTRVFNAVTMPAMQAIIVNTVPEEDRARSASRSTALFAIVQIAAPLAGTAIGGTLGFQVVLIIDILSFLLSALLLLPLAPCPGAPALRNAVRSTWHAFRDNASTLFRWTLGTEAVFFLLWGADAALALLILGDRFSTATAGLFSAAMGVGWVLASALIPARFKQQPIRMIAAGAACGPIAAIAFVALVPYGLAAAFLPGVLVGVGNLAVVIGATTIFQKEAGAEVAGRLFAVRRAVLNSMLTVSYLLLPGVAAAGFGKGPTLILFSILMFVAVQAMAWLTVRRTADATSRKEPEVLVRG